MASVQFPKAPAGADYRLELVFNKRFGKGTALPRFLAQVVAELFAPVRSLLGSSGNAFRKACRTRSFNVLHHSGRRTCGDTIGWDIVGDDAVGPNNTTCTNGDSLENGYSGTNPCAFADRDWLYVFKIRKAIGKPLLQRRGVAVVIGDNTLSRYQDVIFDDDFPVAGNGNIVTDKRPVPDTQCRTIPESAG